MAEINWWVAVVRLSDSFRHALAALAAEVGAGIVDWVPNGSDSTPPGTRIVLILAGGDEAKGLDQVADLNGQATPRYLVGSLPSHRIAATAVQRGAEDYFALPDDLDLLRRTLDREAQEVRGRADASRLAEIERRQSGFEAILGQSTVLRETLASAARVAGHRDVTVLIQGETGTGKELLARAIHYDSPRAAEPFVEINCAAIPSSLLENELFGQERGAFSGATTTKPGLFELAHGGTIFLDEVDSLPSDLRPKVLRTIENHSIRRVGGRSPRDVDVRVLAATNIDLKEAVRRGEFPDDLYYRLAVVVLALPPLRRRGADLELLSETFLARLATSLGLPVPELTPEIRDELRSHSWPGNIRELQNAIERALVLSPPGTLCPDSFVSNRPRTEAGNGLLPFPADLITLARAAAHAMLELTGGNKSDAARRLGISRRRLQRLLDGSAESFAEEDDSEQGDLDATPQLGRRVVGSGRQLRM